MRGDDISEIYRHPEKRMRCLLVLVPFLFLVGLVGGVIGGVIAPMTIDGWSFRIPGRIVILAGVLGAAIGLLPGLLSGIVAYFVSKLQSHREIAVLLHLLTLQRSDKFASHP